jgi:DNA invertase Pin-like site-specific DNA recombinase
MRAALYVRVSTEREQQAHTIEHQAQVRQAARRKAAASTSSNSASCRWPKHP